MPLVLQAVLKEIDGMRAPLGTCSVGSQACTMHRHVVHLQLLTKKAHSAAGVSALLPALAPPPPLLALPAAAAFLARGVTPSRMETASSRANRLGTSPGGVF